MSNNPEIDAAIHLLTEAGYTVAPPLCPECKGNGYVVAGMRAWGSQNIIACPRGCALRVTYNGTPNDFGTKPMPPRPMNAGMPGMPTDARARSTRTHDL